MSDVVSDMVFPILFWLVVTCVFFAPFVLIFFYRSKIKWFHPVRYRILAFKLKEGRKIQENGYVREEDIDGVPVWETEAWEIKKEKIPWLYVQISGWKMKGFEMDWVGNCLARKINGKNVIRILEVATGTKSSDNFIYIDIPEKLEPNKVQTAVSTTASTTMRVVRVEMTRPQASNKWMEWIVPIAALIISLLIFIFALQFGNDMYNRSVSLGTSQLSAVCTNSIAHFINTTNATGVGSGGNIIPFKVA